MREISDSGFEIITTSSRDAYTEKLAQEFSWIEMKYLERAGKNPFRDLLLFVEYIRVYKKQKPDLVFNFTIKPNIYSSFACRILGIPYLSTVTGLGYSFLKSGFLQNITTFLYKIALRKNKVVVFQNQDDLELFVSKNIISRDKTILIEGSGVDTEKFIPKNTEQESSRARGFIFLLCGRMLKDKGIVEFAQASRIAKQQFPNARFQLLGPMDTVNPACISESEMMLWQKEKLVEYLGERDNVVSALQDADCVVLPSYREGLPKSLLEAMSCGKPVIATDIPGCRSVVMDQKNGFLVPVKNSQVLAEKMIEMINLDPGTRTKMGQVGRAMVLEKFDQKIIIRNYLELITKTLG